MFPSPFSRQIKPEVGNIMVVFSKSMSQGWGKQEVDPNAVSLRRQDQGKQRTSFIETKAALVQQTKGAKLEKDKQSSNKAKTAKQSAKKKGKVQIRNQS